MNRLLVFPLLSALMVISTVAASPLDAYRAEKISDSVWVIHGPLELPNPENRGFINNPAFVKTGEGVVVIDPGSSVETGRMLLREIRKVTDQPVIAVFDTHVHGDHWLGNDAVHRVFPGAVIYGHSKMIRMVEDGAGQTWIDRFNSMTDGAVDGTRIVNAGKALEGGETLSLGGEAFTIFHYGPAHTETDIMIHYATDNVLFTGDNVSNGRILRIDGSFKGSINTIERAVAIQPEIVVPGHGRSGGIEIMEDYRTYLSTLYASVRKHYDDGLMAFEMKPKVDEALAEYRDWPGYEDELGKHISNAYLEIEAEFF